MPDYYVGIDLGTSSVKALVVAETGTVIARGSAEYPVDSPRPGFAEQDPAMWWRATALAVRQALAAVASPGTMVAIGLTGQMHGTVLLGARHEVLGPAVIWADQRSAVQVREITEMIGAARLIAITGSLLATGFQAATLRWLQQARPELWQQVRAVLLPKDYLRWRMTGVLATEPSDASGTLLLDVRHGKWSNELLTALEIDRSLLPPIGSSTAITGRLTAEATAAFGLPAGIPVIGGAGDAPAAALGAGIVDAETMLLTISTGSQVLIPTTSFHPDPAGRTHTFRAALAPGWYQMGATLAAGMALRWLRDRLFELPGEDAYTRMSAWAEHAPIGADGLLFLPYLVGERTPHMDPAARGLYLGLTARHGRAELVRATMEGAVLATYDAFSVLRATGANPARIVLAGGGARGPLWRRIVADVFGLPVSALTTADQSAIGAVLLAGAGIGRLDPAATAAAWAEREPAIEPDSVNHARYADLFAIYQRQFDKHRDDFHELGTLAAGGGVS